jgi:Family of unknown function (DUF6228)
MSEQLVIASRDPGASLTLSAFDANFMIAEVVGDGLRASARVGTYLSHGFADFFATLAHGWRGWTGTVAWASLKEELKLSATSDRTGHVFLGVTLRRGSPAEWRVATELVLEAGQLDRLAEAARAFEAHALTAG